ncbi:MAG: ABC transporter ATP-binding protein, partial [Gammaproteobacteria bacterium]|nr:ABC transporter ATP-binding protein [Gammaproteobacteria bacterium]
RRQRLKPLHDKVREAEKELASNRSRLTELEARLADESLYVDSSRKDELTQLVQDQAAVKSKIESLEWEWLEASENLEQST